MFPFLEILETTPLFAHLAVLTLLGLGLILFLRNSLRYDAVALFLMIVIMVLGLVPYEEVLANFGHPAIVIVASMFIITSAIVQSGIVDGITRHLSFLYHRPFFALIVLCFLVAIISGFINNIGALAIVIPIALHIARTSHTPVAFFLLPLAFASHLGGYLTLIGTPRNILISNFRAEATGTPFGIFDFLPVGIGLLGIGLVVIAFVSWRHLRTYHLTNQSQPVVRIYTTDVRVAERSKIINLSFTKASEKLGEHITIATIFRDRSIIPRHPNTILGNGDILTLQGSEENLRTAIEKYRLELTGLRAKERNVTNEDEYTSLEAVVPPYAKLAGHTWNETDLRHRFGTNFIGLFRRHHAPTTPLADTKILGNDILLLQGRTESIQNTIKELGLIMVGDSAVQLGRNTTILATLAIFATVMIAATLNLAPLPLIFLSGVMLLIGTGLMSLRSAYQSIEWPVLVLLAGMITLGDTLLSTGTADLIAQALLLLSTLLSPIAILIMVLIVSMLISDFINTTASAVIMAPIAIAIANTLGVSIDPFLMAVAVGASSAYLTPVGHESNAFVMQRGGYKFSDFTRLGIPLELSIIAVATILILLVWPL